MDFFTKNTHPTLSIPQRVDQLRIAGILDELSEKFFPFECKFVNLNFNNWENQINWLNPHFLFVESIWNGYLKTWRGKITQNNIELIRLVNWCKERGIPTIFWNKEDPIHMFTFLGAAFLFDHVFTTDMDCVPLYKRLLGHNRVGVLPFATATQLFNPIEVYQRKDAACFAGSYYAKREERRLDFENLADALLESYSLDIYDRDPYPGNSDYTFPERYRPHIRGSLPVDQIDIAYKSYKLGITLNIVKHSSTMEARRIFELLGCNTLTVTNPCLGIKNLFGDLVLQNDNPNRFAHQLRTLLTDESAYNRLRLLGLRKVLQEHTYKVRLEYLHSKIFGTQPRNTNPRIAVFGVVESSADLKQVQASFERQNYDEKCLFLFTEKCAPKFLEANPSVLPLENFQTALSGQFEYYACLSTRNYYGPNYLMDMALSTNYASVSVIGKSAHFDMLNGNPQFHEELGAYQLIDRLQADRAMIAAHLLSLVDPLAATRGDLWFENLPCLSIDAYNFCANLTAESCAFVDDLVVNCGIPVDKLYLTCDSLTPAQSNYNLGLQLSGIDLRSNITVGNKNFKVTNHPLDYFTFYTPYQGTQKIYIEKEIVLADLIIINELSNKPNLVVYINALIEGQIKFYINYYMETNKFLGGYLVLNRACTTLPVPDKAQYCKLSINIQGNTYGLIKEVLFGPKIIGPISLRNVEVI